MLGGVRSRCHMGAPSRDAGRPPDQRPRRDPAAIWSRCRKTGSASATSRRVLRRRRRGVAFLDTYAQGRGSGADVEMQSRTSSGSRTESASDTSATATAGGHENRRAGVTIRMTDAACAAPVVCWLAARRVAAVRPLIRTSSGESRFSTVAALHLHVHVAHSDSETGLADLLADGLRLAHDRLQRRLAADREASGLLRFESIRARAPLRRRGRRRRPSRRWPGPSPSEAAVPTESPTFPTESPTFPTVDPTVLPTPLSVPATPLVDAFDLVALRGRELREVPRLAVDAERGRLLEASGPSRALPLEVFLAVLRVPADDPDLAGRATCARSPSFGCLRHPATPLS